VATYLLTIQRPLRGRCTLQFTTRQLVSAERAAKRFEAENHLQVIRCQLLGPAAHEHSTDYCIYNRPKPITEVPVMVQAPVKEDDLPEDEGPEEEEEETEE
jgi:hypothetical protein